MYKRVRQAHDFTRSAHEAVMFQDCRRVIHPSTIDPAARHGLWGGSRLPSWRDDLRAAFRGPSQVGCGGRVFWTLAEPKFWPLVGYVGICHHCGDQTFTLDLLRTAEEVDLARAEYGPSRGKGARLNRAA